MSTEQTPNPPEKPVCTLCENNVSETYSCEICEQEIGDCCQAGYNQFSQIDYNCCKICASRHN